MVKAIFYCDIVTEDGDLVDVHVDFNEEKFGNEADVQEYIQINGYEAGEPCGYWGPNTGIYRECVLIIYEET